MRAKEFIGKKMTNEAGMVSTFTKGIHSIGQLMPAAAQSISQIMPNAAQEPAQQSSQPARTKSTTPKPGMSSQNAGSNIQIGANTDQKTSTKPTTPPSTSNQVSPNQKAAQQKSDKQQQTTMSNLDKIAAQVVALKQDLMKQQQATT